MEGPEASPVGSPGLAFGQDGDLWERSKRPGQSRDMKGKSLTSNC